MLRRPAAVAFACAALACRREPSSPRRLARDAAVAAALVEEAMPVGLPAMAEAPADDVRAVAAGCARLGYALWPHVRDGAANGVFSPVSACASLAMASALSDGAPARAVREALAPGFDEARFDAAMGTLLRRVSSAQVALVQRGFASRGSRADEGVFGRLRASYGAPLAWVDFGGPEGVRQRIQGFFEARTAGAFREVVPEGAIVAGAPVVLAATARVHLLWEGESSELVFRTGGVSPVASPAMTRTGTFGVVRGARWIVVELPAGDDLRMDLVLPDQGVRLDEVEGALGRDGLATLARGLVATPATVTLPVIRITNEAPMLLRNAFEEVGVGDLFDPERSSLRIAPRGGYVSEVFHAASVEFTLVAPQSVVPSPPGAQVIAFDRPFDVVVRDARFDLPVAIGHLFGP